MSLELAFKAFASLKDNTEATSDDVERWCKNAGICERILTTDQIKAVFDMVKVKDSSHMTFSEVESFVVEVALLYKDVLKIELFLAVAEVKEKLSALSSAVERTTGDALKSVRQLDDPSTGSTKRVKVSKKFVVLKNIPEYLSVVDLAGYVSGYGRVVKMICHDDNGEVEVEFSKSSQAEDFSNDNPLGFCIDEQWISISLVEKSVDQTDTDKEVQPKVTEEKKTLVLRNYRFKKVTMTGFYNLLSLYGAVTQIQIHKEKDLCVVKFQEPSHASNALQMIQNILLFGLHMNIELRDFSDANDSDMETKEFDPTNALPMCSNPPSDFLTVEGFPEAFDENGAVNIFNVRATVLKFRFTGVKDGVKSARVQLLCTSEGVEAVMVLNGRAFAKSDKTLSVSFAAAF